MKRIFLGGTCNESKWRELLISKLDSSKLTWFNPVVEDWTSADMANELVERDICDICLYVITPKMTGVYSIAEAVEDSVKKPNKTIFTYLKTEPDSDLKFDEHQIKSLKQVGRMILHNGCRAFDSIEELSKYLNKL